MTKINIFYFAVFAILFLGSCSKEKEFLDEKPNQSLIVPSSLSDFERLLNNQWVFNLASDPSLGNAASDEYYIPDVIFNSLSVDYHRNQYIWAPNIEQGSPGSTYGGEWKAAYEQVFYCNVVLEGLEKLSEQDKSGTLYNEIKGRALFLRSWAFYNLVQIYAMPYDPKTSHSYPGIPLRLSSDINAKSTRATIQECYDQILADVSSASRLLPEKGSYKTNPSAISSLGFLARIYLAMSDYEKALQYSELFLSKYNVLTDFNTLPAVRNASINTTFLDEDVFQVSINTNSPASRQGARISQSFYNSYNDRDLRKTRYFRMNKGEIFFKGSYSYFGGYHYSGIATDEIYLIRAECYARNNQADLALQDVNHLLKYRWDANAAFTPIVAGSAGEALKIILEERRKELLFRGLRWTDLRRLNKEPEFRTTLTRVVNGQQFTLFPNDKKYALPIPSEEVQLSGIQQNDR
jgi:hypothetical protein